MRINISLLSLKTIIIVVALVIPFSITSAEEEESPLRSLQDPTLSIKYDRINFSHDAEKEWGIDYSDY
ncbi:MAG: hypothetical protein V3V59_07255 [Thermodesulfovibrionales bacterium]